VVAENLGTKWTDQVVKRLCPIVVVTAILCCVSCIEKEQVYHETQVTPDTPDGYTVLDAVSSAISDRIGTGKDVPADFAEIKSEVAERSGALKSGWTAAWSIHALDSKDGEVKQGKIDITLFDKNGKLLMVQSWPIITEDPKYHWNPQFAWDAALAGSQFVPAEDSMADLLALMVYEYAAENGVAHFGLSELKQNPLYEDFEAQSNRGEFSFLVKSLEPLIVIVDGPAHRFEYPSDGWGSTAKVKVQARSR